MSQSDDRCQRCGNHETLTWDGAGDTYLGAECRRLEPLQTALARIAKLLGRLVELVDGIDGRLQG